MKMMPYHHKPSSLITIIDGGKNAVPYGVYNHGELAKGKQTNVIGMNAAVQSHVNIRERFTEAQHFFYLLQFFFFFFPKYQQTKNLVLKELESISCYLGLKCQRW